MEAFHQKSENEVFAQLLILNKAILGNKGNTKLVTGILADIENLLAKNNLL